MPLNLAVGADPDATVQHPRTRTTPPASTRQMPTVAAPGTHTGGAVTLLKMLDEQDRVGRFDRTDRAGRRRFGVRPRPNRSVREIAQRRAAARLRHERHLETLETVRAYLAVLCLIAVFLLITVMAIVAFGILAGWWTWGPTNV
jgi:hypothetical protein